MGKLTISMAIFNSYVSSPEGSKCSTVDSGEPFSPLGPSPLRAGVPKSRMRTSAVPMCWTADIAAARVETKRWWNDGKAMGKAMGIFMI